MPLATGTRLGTYEILAPIGAGGMGEVYRARDTALKRDVALKVLPEAFAGNRDRMARFQREAEVLASLNHPNIAHIYGIAESDTGRALAMELVEGVPPKGPLPFDEAWKIASQIVAALDYAHDRGIVHRDLKPANILITPEGVVKLLDFGLAKALTSQREGPPPSENSSTLTLTLGVSEVGTILGTAAYMSPEQAKGKQVDKRADIWSFGVVLYELLTGERLFHGEDVADTLAQVLTKQPDLDKAPAKARRLLGRCLEKDPRKRLRDIGDAQDLLEEPLAPVVAAKAGRSWAWLAVAAALLLALAASLAWIFKPSPPLPLTRFSFTLGGGQSFSGSAGTLAISPDGAQIAYAANQRLYLRSMADLEARALPGSDLGGNATNPVFSPDGKSLAFYEAKDQTLKRIAVSGGIAATICTARIPLGMTWSEEGIVFAQIVKGILRVSPNGGQPETLIAAGNNEYLEAPQMLPGGQEVLFTLGTGSGFGFVMWDTAQIVVQNLKSGVRKVVLQGGHDARYLPTGHLVYVRGGVLFAVPFDLRRLETSGGPVGIVEGVARTVFGTAQFASSGSGSLIYVPGPVSAEGAPQNILGLIDRKGAVEPLKVPPGGYGYPRVSKDGKKVAYEIDAGKDSSIWIYELSGATAPRRLTLPGTGANRYPIWSADGERIAFQSAREGDPGIWWQRADGNGSADRITKPEKGAAHIPDSWSPDGQRFSFTEEKNNASAIWTYSVRDKKATPFAETPGASLTCSVFSPDGRWVAYQSFRLSAIGATRVFVRPFPPTATAFVAPEDGDTHHPLWSPDGKELFYSSGPSLFGSVSVSTQPGVSFGSPVRAPRSGFITAAPGSVRPFDILPDGKRFIGVIAAGEAASGGGPPQIQVVLNWFEDVKQRAPAK